MTIGNPSCKFNARSSHLRCAVNPDGPCDGCQHFDPAEIASPETSKAGEMLLQFMREQWRSSIFAPSITISLPPALRTIYIDPAIQIPSGIECDEELTRRAEAFFQRIQDCVQERRTGNVDWETPIDFESIYQSEERNQ